MPPKKSINDDQVLEKALFVISEKGPDTFTLAEVGKAVGLAPATLMQRFGSKRMLLIRAAKHVPMKLSSDLKILKAKGLSWDKELLVLLGSTPEGLITRQEIANSLGLLKLDMIDPELHAVARDLMSRLRQRIQELLEQGKKEGSLKSQASVEQIAWELDALRHGLVIQWTLSGEGSLQEWLEKGIQNYLEGKK